MRWVCAFLDYNVRKIVWTDCFEGLQLGYCTSRSDSGMVTGGSSGKKTLQSTSAFSVSVCTRVVPSMVFFSKGGIRDRVPSDGGLDMSALFALCLSV